MRTFVVVLLLAASLALTEAAPKQQKNERGLWDLWDSWFGSSEEEEAPVDEGSSVDPEPTSTVPMETTTSAFPLEGSTTEGEMVITTTMPAEESTTVPAEESTTVPVPESEEEELVFEPEEEESLEEEEEDDDECEEEEDAEEEEEEELFTTAEEFLP